MISFLEFVKKFSTEFKAFVYLEKVRWADARKEFIVGNTRMAALLLRILGFEKSLEI